jgi:hypothetical protein
MRLAAESDRATNSLPPDGPRHYRVTAPLVMSGETDFHVKIVLEPGVVPSYEHRDHQVFHEGWGILDLIGHRFALSDGRRVSFIESWTDYYGDGRGRVGDVPFPPAGLEPA